MHEWAARWQCACRCTRGGSERIILVGNKGCHCECRASLECVQQVSSSGLAYADVHIMIASCCHIVSDIVSAVFLVFYASMGFMTPRANKPDSEIISAIQALVPQLIMCLLQNTYVANMSGTGACAHFALAALLPDDASRVSCNIQYGDAMTLDSSCRVSALLALQRADSAG